jgi:hypothetical protein
VVVFRTVTPNTMLGTLLALLPLLVVPIVASPVHAPHSKRWNQCWGYNPAGCPFPNEGSHGAVATEVGTCSAIGVQVLKEGGSAADGETESVKHG